MSENNYEICKEVVLEATPEQVWHAIATTEGQEAAFRAQRLPR